MRVLKAILLLHLFYSSVIAQPLNLAGKWKLGLTGDASAAQPGTDDSSWPEVTLPQRMPASERIYWLRRTVVMPPLTGVPQLTLGLVAESYQVYANGIMIGDTGDFGQIDVRFFTPRSFPLPPEVARPGMPLVISLRIWNARASWGSLTNGLRDRGPYWITTSEHASAEIEAARKSMRLALTPALIVIAGECGISLCLLLLWIAERERLELLYFAAYLMLTGVSLILGAGVVLSGASGFWYRIGFRPLNDVAFLFLCLAATVFLRRPKLGWPVLATASVICAALTVRTVYYLYPWLVLLVWQSVASLRQSVRKNVAFALPLIVYTAAILNNTVSSTTRIVPAAFDIGDTTLAVTNLIQFLFAGGMMILMLQRLSADRREKQRLASALDAAREIQRSLLPNKTPVIDGYSVGFRSSACYEVGGDYLDIFPLPSGEQVMIVADVAGKGLPAALVGTSFRSMFRAAAGLGSVSLSDTAVRISQLHWNEGQEARRRYVTAIFLRLDPASHCVEIVNAGHNPGFVVEADGTARSIEASGPPLGILPFVKYSTETFPFPEGSRLLLYTDGMTEVFRADDEEYGPERLLEHFRDSRESDSTRALDSIWQALREFAGEIRQRDDMTALTLCRLRPVAKM